MNYNINLFRIFLAVIFINSAGFSLRYFELDTFIVLVGFRFHLSFLVPLFFIIKFDLLPEIKKKFLSPVYKKNKLFFIIIFLPAFITAVFLFFFNDVRIGNPDFFYELGLSSIADYPIYLIWNFPQGVWLLLFLIVTSERIKFNFLYLFLVIPLLFAYEFIPLKEDPINYINIVVFLLLTLSLIILINKFQNIYWIYILFFTLLWSNILAFGSESSLLIRIILANQFYNWKGFFILPKEISEYILIAHAAIFFIIIFILFLFKKKKTVVISPYPVKKQID